jgi:hypothetical protein
MNPDLVCKIQVQTADGEPARGSGYPITRNRIITAAHVVGDAAPVAADASSGDARHITLSFGVTGKTVPAPVYIEWSDAGIDVAVLRCELPPELQPTHKLLATPPNTPIQWFAQGYTDFGKRMRPGGKDGYEGTLTKFSESEATVALGCDAGLIDSKQWAGGSGSVAFDSATAQTALAVITDYEGGKKLDHLIAIPICYLLNFVAIKDRFRTAIGFGSYQSREDHYKAVIDAISLQFSRMDDEVFLMVARKVAEIAGAEVSDVDLKKNTKDVLINHSATRLVHHPAVSDVVGDLVSLKQILPREEFTKVAIIVDYLLPLNYAPHTIQQLRAQVSQGKIGLVKDEIATRTLAEVIMAGHDQRQALYIDLSKRKTNDIPGRTAVDIPDDPEVGPELLPRVWNMVRNLAAEKDSVLGLDGEPARQGFSSERVDAKLVGEIESHAKLLRKLLRNAIKTTSKIHGGRRLYCVLGPLKNPDHRNARLQVLEEVAKQVPGLMFVELIEMSEASDLELETRDYIVARLAYT